MNELCRHGGAKLRYVFVRSLARLASNENNLWPTLIEDSCSLAAHFEASLSLLLLTAITNDVLNLLSLPASSHQFFPLSL